MRRSQCHNSMSHCWLLRKCLNNCPAPELGRKHSPDLGNGTVDEPFHAFLFSTCGMGNWYRCIVTRQKRLENPRCARITAIGGFPSLAPNSIAIANAAGGHAPLTRRSTLVAFDSTNSVYRISTISGGVTRQSLDSLACPTARFDFRLARTAPLLGFHFSAQQLVRLFAGLPWYL